GQTVGAVGRRCAGDVDKAGCVVDSGVGIAKSRRGQRAIGIASTALDSGLEVAAEGGHWTGQQKCCQREYQQNGAHRCQARVEQRVETVNSGQGSTNKQIIALLSSLESRSSNYDMELPAQTRER